jgi:hypothetical protein
MTMVPAVPPAYGPVLAEPVMPALLFGEKFPPVNVPSLKNHCAAAPAPLLVACA